MTFELFGISLWSPYQRLKTRTGREFCNCTHVHVLILEYCHGDTILDIGMCSFVILLSLLSNNNETPLETKPFFGRGRS